MDIKRFIEDRRRIFKSGLDTIESKLKEHPLFYISLALILSPIIVNIASEAILRSDPEIPDPIIFAEKMDSPQQILQKEVYVFRGIFSVHNPSEETLIVLNNIIRIPGEWLIKEDATPNQITIENISVAEKIDKELSGGIIDVQRSEDIEESKPYLAEIKPKETQTFPVAFAFKTHNVSGIYSFNYCSVTLRGEFCSEDTYTVFNLTAFSKEDI